MQYLQTLRAAYARVLLKLVWTPAICYSQIVDCRPNVFCQVPAELRYCSARETVVSGVFPALRRRRASRTTARTRLGSCPFSLRVAHSRLTSLTHSFCDVTHVYAIDHARSQR